MQSLRDRKPTSADSRECPLVGWAPLISFHDAGMAPNPGPSRPAGLRSKLCLIANNQQRASKETASYFLDKALVNSLRPGDVLHLAHTSCAGVPASAIRQGKLIFAVGQISALPLGSGIQAGQTIIRPVCLWSRWKDGCIISPVFQPK